MTLYFTFFKLTRGTSFSAWPSREESFCGVDSKTRHCREGNQKKKVSGKNGETKSKLVASLQWACSYQLLISVNMDLPCIFQVHSKPQLYSCAANQRNSRRKPIGRVYVTWDKRYNELVRYKWYHKDCLVPSTYPKLGPWVAKQRWLDQTKVGSLSYWTS